MGETAVRFVEAIDFLRRRLELPPGRWGEILRLVDAAARDRSAGMTDALANDVARAVLDAIENGGTLATFIADWERLTVQQGWADESGGRRAALAFRTMTSQAYAAGRWAQIQRLKASRPYLRYVHVDPGLTQQASRHEHAAWHGLILPVDHGWWDVHYPPNGWNCRCYVQQVGRRDLVRFGWEVADRAPADQTVIRFVKGAPVESPAGVDPGFAVNWGAVGLLVY